MPLFECEKCHCIDNTALTQFWSTFIHEDKLRLCSACDPEIGAWHDIFPREQMSEYSGAREVAYPARNK